MANFGLPLPKRAENVLVFAPDFSKVKLTDFGLTRKAGTLVKKRCVSLPTCPPEVWTMVLQEGKCFFEQFFFHLKSVFENQFLKFKRVECLPAAW